MAAIKGVQLKSVKTFESRNGYGFSANLYINNKKVGVVGDEGRGGETDISIIKKEDRETFYQIVQQYYQENPADSNASYDFVEELLGLSEMEKIFKNNLKKGFTALVDLRYTKRQGEDLSAITEIKVDEVVGLRNISHLNTVLEGDKPVEYTVYQDLNDFILQ